MKKNIKKQIMDEVKVERSKLTYAKSYVLKHIMFGFTPSEKNISNTTEVIKKLLEDVDASVVNNKVWDNDPYSISKAAKYISWSLAGAEAIWELLNNNYFIIVPERSYWDQSFNLKFFTNNRTPERITFDEFTIDIPRVVIPRPSGINKSDQPISDPDLYLKELNIKNLNKEVEKALREAISCFKNELYLGCLVMLVRAMEGVWMEFGRALIKGDEHNSLNEIIDNENVDINKKVKRISDLYVNKYEGDLYHINMWTNNLRAFRNSIHMGVEPSMSICYETISTLILATKINIENIYLIINKIQEN